MGDILNEAYGVVQCKECPWYKSCVTPMKFTAEDLRGGCIRLAIATGLFASNGEARRTISQGGLAINDERVSTPEAAVPEPIAGRYLVVRMGKKALRIGRLKS